MIYKWELRHPCYCGTIWCKDMRQLSLHRITTFKFPNDVAEQQLWLKAVLGVNGSAAKIEVPPNVQSLRVSAVHFFAEDLLHNKSGGIRLRKQSEKGGHNYGRTDPCNKMGPLPRATESDAAKLMLSDFEWFGFDDGAKRRRREEEAPKYFNVYNDDELKDLVLLKYPQQTAAVDLSDASKKKPVRRRRMKLCTHSYMGTADLLVLLEMDIEDHAKHCEGSVYRRNRGYAIQRGLGLDTTRECSKGSECSVWPNGIYKWSSCERKEIEPTGELMSLFHCRYAIASTTTSVGKGAAEDLLRGMLFKVPSRNTTDRYIERVVAPTIHAKKKQIIDEKVEELKKSKIPVRLDVDACHNHSRAAQGSTLTYSVGGEMVGTKTMVVGNPWRREQLLLESTMEELISTKGLDVETVGMDKSAANGAVVSKFERKNAERPELVKTKVGYEHDAWRVANKTSSLTKFVNKWRPYVVESKKESRQANN